MHPDKSQVLVVDDDPIMRKLVAAQLSSANVNLAEAKDGAVAWQLLRDESYDLAIVDLGMPNLNGFDLIRCVRGHPRTKHMAIVVITSREDGAAMRDALEAGANSLLIKPVVWTTFKPHVTNLLRLTRDAMLVEARLNEANETIKVRDKRISKISEDLNSDMRAVKNGMACLTQILQTDPAQSSPALLRKLAQQMQRVEQSLSALERQTPCAAAGGPQGNSPAVENMGRRSA